MTPKAWSKLSLAIWGDDLVAAATVARPWGAKCRSRVARRFLSMGAAEARSALAPADAGGRVVLVVPAAWCAVRPIQISLAQWGRARTDILQSIDRLLPLPADDAMVGLLESGAESVVEAGGSSGSNSGGNSGGGWLIGVRRSAVQPWIEAIEAALGRRVSEVVSSHMALLGLGLQRVPEVVIIEPRPAGGAPGLASAHRLAHGRPVALAEPALEAPGGALRLAIASPGAEDAPSSQGESAISARDLAIGAAIAPSVAPGAYWPILGKGAPPRRRWLPGALAAAAAVALLAAAGPTHDARLRAAGESIRARHAALEPRLIEAQRQTAEAERLARLVRVGVVEPAAGWGSVLPLAIEARRAIGEDGFLYRLEIAQSTVTLSGEAGSASDVLERFAAAPMVSGARHAAPVSKAPASRRDSFEIRAERVKKGGAK